MDGLGDEGPRGGFLGDHEGVGLILEDRRVELAQKLHGFEIPRIAVPVWLPLAFLTAVVEIEHIGHGVNPKAVDVVLLHPKKRVGNQKTLDFRAAVIKICRPPPPVLRPLRIIRFVEVQPVKTAQTLIVIAKMPRHPIHDDPDSRLMGLVH